MSDSAGVQTHFSGGAETPELDDYRPISPLVIVACIATFVSLLALAHPLLWICPAIAAILSICAMVQVSAAQSRFSGRSLAAVCLCATALIGAYAPARSLSREHVLYTQARAKAEQLFSLLRQGRVQEAHQLTQSPVDRYKGPETLATYYTTDPVAETPSMRRDDNPDNPPEMPADVPRDPPSLELENFLKDAVIAKLVAYGPQVRIEHIQNFAIQNVYGTLKVTQQFQAHGVDNGQPESIDFLLRSQRRKDESTADWQVGEFELVE